MQMEDGLAGAGADVDDDLVVVETGVARGVGDEFEHRLGLLRRERADLAESRDVALGDHEQVRVGLRVDVADRDEALGRVMADVMPQIAGRADGAVVSQLVREKLA